MKKKPAAINTIWFSLIVVSIITAAYTGKMDILTKASFDSAKSAVTLALSLIGTMALWLGIFKVAEAAGLTHHIARAIRPVMTRLFPDVPADHPAMSAMIMNMAANMLGLGNAATPFGIKAMTELDKINPRKGTATNAMCLFLAINTSSVTLLPLGVIAIRAAAGARQPASILIPAIVATMCSTTAAIIAAKLFTRKIDEPLIHSPTGTTIEENEQTTSDTPHDEIAPVSILMKICMWVAVALLIGAIPYTIIKNDTPLTFSLDLITAATSWLVPLIMGGLLFYGCYRGIKVYEVATDGAKEGFQVAIRIIPFMVAIFVAIGMFRASGALELFCNLKFVAPVFSWIGMPVDVLPMAILRPLSGTGAFGVMSELINNAPDSFSAFLASVMQGSTETTFYVLAVYFGAVGITRSRHALTAALIADATGIIASIVVSRALFPIFQ
jgi:spore maturation protein SpmA